MIPVKVEGWDCEGLLDTGSQIITIGITLAAQLGLEVWPLETLGLPEIKVVGCGDQLAHIYGWFPVEITIPQVRDFKKRTYPVLITTNSYQESPIHITLGTNLISDMIELTSEGELLNAQGAWNRAYHSILVSVHREVLGHKGRAPCCESKRGSGSACFQASWSRVFCDVPVACGRVSVVCEAVKDLAKDVKIDDVYTESEGGETPCILVVQNYSARPLKLKKGQTLGTLHEVEKLDFKNRKLEEADLPKGEVVKSGCATVLNKSKVYSLVATPTPEESRLPAEKPQTMTKKEREELLMQKLDLTALEGESPANQKKARNL